VENSNSFINAEKSNETGNNAAAPSESFLWATREIAALDFLMNIPLKSEKDIVRSGLSGGRWHRHHASQLSGNSGAGAEVINEESKNWRVPHGNRNLSCFDISRSSGIDDEGGRSEITTAGTESSIHTLPLFNEHNRTAGGGWWDKLVLKDKRFFSVANQQAQRREQLELEERELERPTESPSLVMMNSVAGGRDGGVFSNIVAFNAQGKGGVSNGPVTPSSAPAAGGVPGRRLDGREAISITIIREFRRRPPALRTVARQAAVREWEIRVAYGQQDMKQQQTQQPNIGNHCPTTTRNALLDGRIFFSTKKSYPLAIFSTIKYEPQREAFFRRRKELFSQGGGGTQFVLPERDWRGISYRALLPQVQKQNTAFNRLIGGNKSPLEKRPMKIKQSSPRDRGNYDDTSSSGEDNGDDPSESSSEESTAGYFPGFLDDPQMLFGRNRNVMMGDKVTGPIISSTIQFIKPSVLKADLNKQFRERFDQWEPPKSQRRYIGAKVIDGVYTLIDTTETMQEDVDNVDNIVGHHRGGSIAAEHKRATIRMPPSLTLSKIRSLKQQALVACVRARIEISTLALACIYFERLCLDCRVDKSNRRLSFAACLLLAVKINESNSMIAYDRGVETKSDGSQLPLMTSWVKPNRKSGKIFESLIVFFTHDWSLSLKQLYAAEWIVFTALGFSLKAKPSEVAFHFKRLLRVLEWNPRSYIGSEMMYGQWQESLMEESRQDERRIARRELRIKRNERKLLKLQRKLHMQQTVEDLPGRSSRRSSTTISDGGASQHGIIFRRNSADVTPISSFGVDANKRSLSVHSHSDKSQEALDSPGRLLRSSRKVEPIRGILSRLSRPKQAVTGVRPFPSIISHGKELDKLPELEKKNEIPLSKSISVPNLSSLDSKTNDSAVDFNTHEGNNEIHNDHFKKEDGEGLFI